MLLGITGFGLLFGLFGAMVGFVSLREGRAGGTGLGLAVARAFARLSQQELSPLRHALIVGLVDGLSFGVVVGVVLGLVAGWHFPAEGKILGIALLGTTMLAGVAVALGLLASRIDSLGVRALVGLFLGGMAGALTGFSASGTDGLFTGILAGAAFGALLSRASRDR